MVLLHFCWFGPSEAARLIPPLSRTVTSPKSNSEINEKEILRESFIPPELRHKVINDLRLKGENYWFSKT